MKEGVGVAVLQLALAYTLSWPPPHCQCSSNMFIRVPCNLFRACACSHGGHCHMMDSLLNDSACLNTPDENHFVLGTSAVGISDFGLVSGIVTFHNINLLLTLYMAELWAHGGNGVYSLAKPLNLNVPLTEQLCSLYCE